MQKVFFSMMEENIKSLLVEDQIESQTIPGMLGASMAICN